MNDEFSAPIFRKQEIQRLTRAIFDAAAWIAVARLSLAKLYTKDAHRITIGEFGTGTIDPYWAGFTREAE
jgi:hypothetical protein